MSNYLKYLLYPFSLLYGLGTSLRNLLYERGVYKGLTFSVPTVNIGNLSTGGTGKTPMVEFLIEAFYDQFQIATLSRGYRRKTRGFVLAGPESTALTIGDEPYQYYLKYPRISVAVCEDRVIGIPMLMQQRPETEVILLDDAYQHRAVAAGINVLLTRYDRPYTDDHLLPMGSLRETRNGAERADIIIVTKCPADMPASELPFWHDKIKPTKNQSLYFSTLSYGDAYLLWDPQQTTSLEGKNILAVSGIASSSSYLQYLRDHAAYVHPLSYSDHQYYNLQKAEEILETFQNLEEPKIIITTEKDAVKLVNLKQEFKDLPLYVQPVKTEILHGEKPQLINKIYNYIKEANDSEAQEL